MGISKIEIEKRVLSALNNIRPFLNEDGGDVELIEITQNNTVKVRFTGACTTCNMSNMTFKAGIEDGILKSVPEVIGVELV